MIKIILLTLNIYSGFFTLGEPLNSSMFQYSFNKAMCKVNTHEDSCVAYCYDADYFGHDIDDELTTICKELL